MKGFNPLTGIRSFLTFRRIAHHHIRSPSFQSPHGDSFFSDTMLADWQPAAISGRFNPLTGIRSFLTQNFIPPNSA